MTQIQLLCRTELLAYTVPVIIFSKPHALRASVFAFTECLTITLIALYVYINVYTCGIYYFCYIEKV